MSDEDLDLESYFFSLFLPTCSSSLCFPFHLPFSFFLSFSFICLSYWLFFFLNRSLSFTIPNVSFPVTLYSFYFLFLSIHVSFFFIRFSNCFFSLSLFLVPLLFKLLLFLYRSFSCFKSYSFSPDKSLFLTSFSHFLHLHHSFSVLAASFQWSLVQQLLFYLGSPSPTIFLNLKQIS